MTRWSFTILVCISMSSCGKEDIILPMAPDNCDVLSTYSFEFDLVEEYGTSFIYENISSGEMKSFSYSDQESIYDVVNERILCTDISYARSAILIYEDSNSSDEIRLQINQSINNEYIPTYFLQGVSGIFNGKSFDELRFIQNVDNVHLDEHNSLIYHDRTFDILFAFDDREGNQWLKTSSSRLASVFYCRVNDNIGEHINTSESLKLNSLFEKSSIDFTDGFVSSYSFQPESKYGYSNFIGSENEQACFEEELDILETASESFEFQVGNAYRMFYNVTTGFESIESPNYYTILSIQIQYLLDFTQLYAIRVIFDNGKLYIPQQYEDPFTEYVFFDSLLINGQTFENVYEFEYRDRKLFFNFENGIVTFDDHLNITNYLRIN